MLLAQLKYVPQALRLVWTAAKSWTIASTVILVLQSLVPVLNVYLIREVVNALVGVLGNGGRPEASATLITYGSLLGVVLVLGAVLGSVQSYIRAGLSEHTQDHITDLIQRKAISLDLPYYESATYYDQLQRASVDAINHPQNVLENLSGLLQGTITLLGMAGLLLGYAWWLPLAILLSTLPAFWVTLKTNKAFQDWRLRNTFNQRRLLYFGAILLRDQAAAEVRLFNLGEYFRQSFRTLRQSLRRERLDLARSQLFWQVGAALIGLLTLGLILLWVAWRALNGQFNLGDLALFWQVLNQGQRQVQGLLSSAGDIYRNVFFLDDLFSFLKLSPQTKENANPIHPAPGLNQGIQIKDVTFSYPESPSPALKNFNLEIPSGQIVAIVGENGAGKSTLIKLLCRFYDPQHGSLLWDGTDLRQMSTADLRRRITVMFQQPVPYHETAAMNIRLGDLENNPEQTEIEKAAQAGGAASLIEKLPEGYETVLGKWFGYTELSVGEWQRIALARAFVRQADLVILDEPTSAMDSWAESEWMGRFRNLVAGKTALIITHRFTTAMQADIIHVMEDGRVVESGSHAQLVAQGGRYAASWKSQVNEHE